MKNRAECREKPIQLDSTHWQSLRPARKWTSIAPIVMILKPLHNRIHIFLCCWKSQKRLWISMPLFNCRQLLRKRNFKRFVNFRATACKITNLCYPEDRSSMFWLVSRTSSDDNIPNVSSVEPYGFSTIRRVFPALTGCEAWLPPSVVLCKLSKNIIQNITLWLKSQIPGVE